MRTNLRRGLLASIAALALTAAPAAAHIHVSPSSAPAGSTELVTFTVPHGCDGSPTTGISVQIPESIFVAKPVPKAGWELSTEQQTIPPVDLGEGETATERVSVVTWSGGELLDAYLDEFSMEVQFPDAEGSDVAFPIVQTCTEGETAWIQIPAEGQSEDDLEDPAPLVALTAAAEGHGHDDEEEAATGEAAHDDNGRANLAIGLGAVALVTGVAALVIALRRKPKPEA